MYIIYTMHWIDNASFSKKRVMLDRPAELKTKQKTKGKKDMLRTTINALGLASLFAVFGGIASAKSTTEVWTHHIHAWEIRSVHDIVSDYSDESVLVLNNEVFKGQDQIANVFTRLFNIFDAGTNRIDTPVVLDRFVYITWHFTPTNKQEFFGTDTFVIENGKIVLQTIASPLYKLFPVQP